MNERERIGLRIKELRTSANLSQEKLAELAGVGQGHIARIEQGKYSTGIDVLAKIAEALNVKIDFISLHRPILH